MTTDTTDIKLSTEPTLAELASFVTQLAFKLDREAIISRNTCEAISAIEAKLAVMSAPRLTEQAIVRPTDQTLALVAELKAWRLETWKSTPGLYGAHNIFHNRAMNAIAANLPADRYELQLINGIGEKAMALYADEILAIVKKYRPKVDPLDAAVQRANAVAAEEGEEW